jgi:hypothetical protein
VVGGRKENVGSGSLQKSRVGISPGYLKGRTIARLSQENGQGVAAGVDMLDRYLYQVFGFQVDAAGLR